MNRGPAKSRLSAREIKSISRDVERDFLGVKKAIPCAVIIMACRRVSGTIFAVCNRRSERPFCRVEALRGREREQPDDVRISVNISGRGFARTSGNFKNCLDELIDVIASASDSTGSVKESK